MKTIKAFYENDIEIYIDEYCEKYNIQDLSRESQNRWSGCLAYVNKKMFMRNRILKDENGTHNEYDFYKLGTLLDIYISLCDSYEKEISISGFEKLTGINHDTFFEWAKDETRIYIDIEKDKDKYIYQDDNIYNMLWCPSIFIYIYVDGVKKLSCTRSDLYKKLMSENERSNSDLLATNPRTIGIMARLNHVHKWNLPGVTKEVASKQLLQRENVVQIDSKKPLELPDVEN